MRTSNNYNNWFWQISDLGNQIYSSGLNAFVDANNFGFQLWLKANGPINIITAAAVVKMVKQCPNLIPWCLLTIEQAKVIQLNKLNEKYQIAVDSDIPFTTINNITNNFQANEIARKNVLNILNAFSAQETLPTDFYWVASDNSRVPFTWLDLKTLANNMGQRGWGLFKMVQDKKSVINNMMSVSDIQIYDTDINL